MPIERFGYSSLFFTTFEQTRKWRTNHTNMKSQQWKTLKRISFLIEHYHRGLKQHFLVEKCQARKIHIQTAYICVCLCSFAKIQRVRQRKRISVTELFKKLHRKQIEQSRVPSSTCETAEFKEMWMRFSYVVFFLKVSFRRICGAVRSRAKAQSERLGPYGAPIRRRSPRSDAEEFL